MTQLDCSVTSCLYNQDHYCAKEDITVGGSNAKKASDTCCESFREVVRRAIPPDMRPVR